MEHVTSGDIQQAIADLGLSGQALCVHSSLRSFGYVEGGAAAVVEGLLAAGCTVMVPTMSFEFAVRPLPHQRPARNGTDYAWLDANAPETAPIFSPACNDLTLRDMGAIPQAVLRRPERVRGNHALCSFTAVGPEAKALVCGQAPMDMYAPFRELIRARRLSDPDGSRADADDAHSLCREARGQSAIRPLGQRRGREHGNAGMRRLLLGL